MRYYIIYLSTLIILCHCFEAAACQLLRYPYSSTLFCSHYLFFFTLAHLSVIQILSPHFVQSSQKWI